MADDQAVLVYLRGNGLPNSVYKEYDLSALEDQLIEAIQSNTLGEFDGNEFGPEETILYMYGPDADKLFAGVESVLRSYPFCKNARVTIRRGPPGSPQREIVP